MANYRRMALWIAIGGCSDKKYWDAVMDRKGPKWDVLAEIGINKEQDGTFVEYLRDNECALSAPLRATRALVGEKIYYGEWDPPPCPRAEEMGRVANLK